MHMANKKPTDQQVREAIVEVGLSYLQAARKLKTTKGIIAGICFRKGYKKQKASAGPLRLPPGAKLRPASSEYTQCQYIDADTGHRCGWEGCPRCILHPEK